MERYLPSNQTKRWTGPYLGNYYGDLWKTYNIDLDRDEGKVSLSRRMQMVADTTDTNSDTIGVVTTFLRTNASGADRFWALSRIGALYRSASTNPSDSWDLDTLDSSPTDARDMTVHENDSDSAAGENILLVTRDTGDIAILNDTANNKWTKSWWVGVKSQTALKGGIHHPIEYFPQIRATLVGDGNLIHIIDKNKACTYGRLVLPVQYQAEHIFTTTRRAWILCSNKFSGNGVIVEWDGYSVSPNDIHNLYAQYPIYGVNYLEVPIVLNNKGMILEYTGSRFEQMERGGQKISFPMVEEEGFSFSTISNPATLGRCMVVGGDGLVYMNVTTPTNSDNAGNSFRQLSGIWCLNPKTGRLYAKYTWGSAGSANFGHQGVSRSGGMMSFDPGVFSSVGFLVGGEIQTTLSSFNTAIWGLENITSLTANKGNFVTGFIPAARIKEWWDFMWIHFKRFRTAANRIVVKAKGVPALVLANRFPIDATGTWASTTTFTCTLSASDDTIVVGDEIEVLYGDNAGLTAHITQISGAQGGSQTFTIDETVVSSTNTFGVRFDRWKKLGVISDTTIQERMFNIGIDSSFIQFKFEFRGPYREMQISDLIVSTDDSKNITK